MSQSVGRRRFLIGGAAAGATAAGAVAAGKLGLGDDARADEPADASPLDKGGVLAPSGKVTLFRRLGRTGLKVSAVGFGAGSFDDSTMLARAADKGINYVDTSVCYGDSEEVIGRALKQSAGLRQKMIIATKWDAGITTPKDRILESLDRSLKRLGVDAIDIMQIHWLGGGHAKDDNGFNRLDNAALYEAMAAAKKAGKVRFFGATSHDGNRGKILQHAIDKGAFDMILVKMNFLDFGKAGIPELLAKAKAKDVGVVVMKSQADGGNIPPGFEKSKLDIYQANLRWCLAQDVHCVVHSGIANDKRVMDLAVGAAQEKLGAVGSGELDREPDLELLDRYATALSPEYCRGCGDICGAACPAGVAIAHVLHLDMYDRRLGWTDYARHLYSELPPEQRWADACATCTDCQSACPHGVDAPARVREARRRLG
jgi:predicted aldo/keto reductase-like oxidoreductase